MSCLNSAVIPAPIDNVWTALRNFHDLSWAPNVVESLEKVGDARGDQVGARRVLNGAIHETLLAVDEQERFIRYSIDDGPGPLSKTNVKGYSGLVRLFPVTDDNTTLVVWTSSWTVSQGGVEEFCDPVYRALLADLKASMAG